MQITSLIGKIPLLVSLLSPCIVVALENSFVGSDQCASCHQQAYVDWKRSDHYKSMAVASAESVLGNFDNTSVSFHNIKSRFYTKGPDYFVATTGSDNNSHEYLISHTFGHHPLQQYLVETGNGHLQVLNLAWDNRDKEEGGQRWIHLQPNEDITPESPFFWTRHLQNWNSRCAECHSTNLQKNYDASNNSYETTWSEINVACESCHGPAAKHLQLVKAGNLAKGSGLISLGRHLQWEFADGESIAKPLGHKSDSYINICGGCHSRRSIISDIVAGNAYHDQYRLTLLENDLYYPDGQIHDEVFVLGSFLQSKMYTKGVTCMNCHQAHSGELVVQGNNLCAQCHLADKYDRAEHHFHRRNSAGAQCVECHMPENRYMLVDDRRDHRFGIPNPKLSQKLNSPNACNQCHQGTTSTWAAKVLADRGKETPDPWAAVNFSAGLGDPAMTRPILAIVAEKDTPAIIKATLLQRLSSFPSRASTDAAANYLSHADPLVRAAAVRSLQSAPPDIRWQLLSPLAEDPVKSIRIEVAIVLSSMPTEIPRKNVERFLELIDEYRSSLEHSIDTPGTQSALGNLELNLGDPNEAEKHYKIALAIEPLYIPALLNLADLYRANSNDTNAQPLLLKALKFAPESSAVNFSYGLLLVRQQKYQAALPFLLSATELEDSRPRYAYVYAVALDSVSLTDKAVEFLEQANQQWPNQYDLLLTQIIYMEKLNLIDGILLPLSKLNKIAPNSPAVRQRVQRYVE